MLPFDRSSTPTYDLEAVQRLVGQGPISCRVSQVALTHARALGHGHADVINAVLSLEASDFYKSMPSKLNPGMWQDVYHLSYAGRVLYVKVQIDGRGDAVIIQFKER